MALNASSSSPSPLLLRLWGVGANLEVQRWAIRWILGFAITGHDLAQPESRPKAWFYTVGARLLVACEGSCLYVSCFQECTIFAQAQYSTKVRCAMVYAYATQVTGICCDVLSNFSSVCTASAQTTDDSFYRFLLKMDLRPNINHSFTNLEMWQNDRIKIHAFPFRLSDPPWVIGLGSGGER